MTCFYAFFLEAIAGVMSLALCPLVVSKAPNYIRSSETQATCDSCFARQFICSVILLAPSLPSPRVSNSTSTGVFEDECRILHMPVWPSHYAFTSGSKLIIFLFLFLRTTAYVVWLSFLKANLYMCFHVHCQAGR